MNNVFAYALEKITFQYKNKKKYISVPFIREIKNVFLRIIEYIDNISFHLYSFANWTSIFFGFIELYMRFFDN